MNTAHQDDNDALLRQLQELGRQDDVLLRRMQEMACRDSSAVVRLPKMRRPGARLPRQTTNLRHGGGQTGLTRELAAKIYRLIRQGANRTVAAKAVGIAPETLSRWMHREGEPYETFAQKVWQAEAGVEVRLAGYVTGEAKKNPPFALEVLSRKYPQRWGKVKAVLPQQEPDVDLAEMLRRIKANRKPDPRGPRPIEASPVTDADESGSLHRLSSGD